MSPIVGSLLILLYLVSVQSLRVLVVAPVASKSHSILGHGIADQLLEAGHQVVHVTSYPRKGSQANLTEIHVTALKNKMAEMNKDAQFKLQGIAEKGHPMSSLMLPYIVYTMDSTLYRDDALSELLNDPDQQFDAVISEWFFSETNAGLGALYQCPFIWFSSTEAHWQVLRLIDEYTNPAYTVDLLSTNTFPMSYRERISELYTFVVKYIIGLVSYPFLWSLYNNVYYQAAANRGVVMPSYSDVIYNASFMLVNSHPSVGSAFKLPQNAKYIGGYHVKLNVEPLPKDLQKLMDEAKHGVIYFSMGSHLLSSQMSEEMKRGLLETFAGLKQTVIWKFEEELDNVPENVYLVKWAPQPSILVHPNLKFFITHGGQLSTLEAITFGVAVLGVPVLGDQNVNMNSVVKKGFGLCVPFSINLPNDLVKPIAEMLSNPTYKQKAKEISQMFHDRPVPPGKELVHWVEHVVRTGGAPHLRSPALMVPWYQKLYLDLWIVVIGALFVLKYVYSILRKPSSKSSSKSAKKKTTKVPAYHERKIPGSS